MENYLIIKPSLKQSFPTALKDCPSFEISPNVLVNTDMNPELYSMLEALLEKVDFEIEIPRQCLTANLIKEKLQKTSPSKRVQALKQLMEKYRLKKIVLVHPKNSTVILTALD